MSAESPSNQTRPASLYYPNGLPRWRQVILITALMAVCAGPSLFFALSLQINPPTIIGMTIAIGAIIVWFFSSRKVQNLLSSRAVHNALVWGIVLRFLGIIFGIVMFLDGISGLFILSLLGCDPMGDVGLSDCAISKPIATACVCLIQAAIVLGGFAIFVRIIHSIEERRLLKLWESLKSKCRQCGYDLRGTHDQCSECGTEPLPEQKAYLAANLPDDDA